mgnify:CR=1 FL=1
MLWFCVSALHCSPTSAGFTNSLHFVVDWGWRAIASLAESIWEGYTELLANARSPTMKSDESGNSIKRELKSQISILGGFVLLMWIVEIVDTVIFNRYLDTYGIRPRDLIGLRGIVFAPFLHGNFPHLIANTIPFVSLGWFVMLREIRNFWAVTLVTMLVGGLGTWLIGAPGLHIGASGLIFGYLGYLLSRGYFDRSFTAMFLSVVVAFLYGGMLWGVLPAQPGISWEGHLFGFLGGVLAARWLSKRSLG